MHWWLAGCCGLALIHISVPLIIQRPRFFGVTAKHLSMAFYCEPSKKHLPNSVEWYKAAEYNTEKIKIVEDTKFAMRNQTSGSFLLITHDLQIKDSGVYFCKINGSWGPGSELRVARRINSSKALHRTKMKDGLMVFQGLLLALCIAGLALRKQTLSEKMDSEYEEPETDHIYEGLTIETCGGGLYEELSVYAQADGAEAPWE
ncbi:B-cell antigen receptor complex-associated protein beta chain [Pempheris klunzingeri]|uniref:B-cell antigen receptor complex-associated protein beta chain n=1 Tax=Pempheris klunzingeri TaxID=3127111 RepID=UPI00397F8ED6